MKIKTSKNNLVYIQKLNKNEMELIMSFNYFII